ncbi:hypothetical protein Emag_003780 [Eimeria magna]
MRSHATSGLEIGHAPESSRNKGACRANSRCSNSRPRHNKQHQQVKPLSLLNKKKQQQKQQQQQQQQQQQHESLTPKAKEIIAFCLMIFFEKTHYLLPAHASIHKIQLGLGQRQHPQTAVKVTSIHQQQQQQQEQQQQQQQEQQQGLWDHNNSSSSSSSNWSSSSSSRGSKRNRMPKGDGGSHATFKQLQQRQQQQQQQQQQERESIQRYKDNFFTEFTNSINPNSDSKKHRGNSSSNGNKQQQQEQQQQQQQQRHCVCLLTVVMATERRGPRQDNLRSRGGPPNELQQLTLPNPLQALVHLQQQQQQQQQQ